VKIHTRLTTLVAVAACALIGAGSAHAAELSPEQQKLADQEAGLLQPIQNSIVDPTPDRGDSLSTTGAANTPKWISGNSAYQSGTNCIILGQPYTEQMVGGFTSYWGTEDVSYPKIGDRYWGSIYVTVTGNTCPYGIADVSTDIKLPDGTELAVNPNSTDPNDKIRCYLTTREGKTGEVTGQTWNAPWDRNFSGKMCNPTPGNTGADGIDLGYRLLAQGTSFHLVFPLRSTKKLSGIADTGNSRLTTALRSGVNTNADPFQWVFVGDRPVETDCTAAGTATTEAITNTSARSKGFLCNWFRTGKVEIQLGEGAAGTTFPTNGPQYDIPASGNAFTVTQDWAGLKPGTDYRWRLHFIDTKGTATSGDDLHYYGQPKAFKTTGTPPTTNPGGNGPQPQGGGQTGTGTGTGTGQKPDTGTGGDTTDPGTGDPGTGDPGTVDPGQSPADQGPQDQQHQTPPADKQAPSLSAAPGKTKLADLLKKGLPVTVYCSEACVVETRVEVDAGTARKLKLGKKAVTIGTGKASLPGQGSGKVTVKLTAKAKKALKRSKSLKVKIVTLARDSAGNASKPATKTVTLKR
jgi:hypothetical protein